MKVVAVSDLHGRLPAIPECDLLIVAGDICPATNHKVDHQQAWLDTEFRAWLNRVPADKILAVWGNHDLIAESHPHHVPYLPWTVLTDDYIDYRDYRIYGLPWQRRFFDWAFNLDEPELNAKYDAVIDCDILISHGPPYKYGDAAPRPFGGKEYCGSRAFIRAIDRINPTLAVFGHIHEGRGTWMRDSTILANVTHVDEKYRPVYDPMEFYV